MAAPAKKTKPPQRRGRPVSPAALRYEAIKAGFLGQALTPAEYAQACRRAARWAKI